MGYGYGRLHGDRFERGPSKYLGHAMFKNYPAVLTEKRNGSKVSHVVLERPGHKDGDLRIRLHRNCVTRGYGGQRDAHADVLLLDDSYMTYKTVMNPETFILKDIATGIVLTRDQVMEMMSAGSDEYERIKGDLGGLSERYRPDYMTPGIEAKIAVANFRGELFGRSMTDEQLGG